MLFFVLLKGVLMGVAIAAPVGPIAVLCIRRTLAQGRLVGLLSGLGAATADGFYGLVAALGLSALADLLVNHASYLQAIGGLFLCYLGLKTFFSKVVLDRTALDRTALDRTALEQCPLDGGLGPDRAGGHSRASAPTFSTMNVLGVYTSTLALTLTNPATILSFIAIFAGLGITQTSYLSSVTLVVGVFSGSALWWLVLVSGVTHLRNRLTPQRLARFNQWATKVFGLLIMGFGLAALLAL